MFKKHKLKKRYYLNLILEILDTIETMCLYFAEQGRRNHSKYDCIFRSHFEELHSYSIDFREDLKKLYDTCPKAKGENNAD